MWTVRTAILGIAFGLVGCAATPKPVLADIDYKSVGASLVGGKKCAIAGHIDAETASLSYRYTMTKLQTFSFDAEKVRKNMALAEGYAVSKEYCTDLAISVATMKRNIEIHNRAVDQERASNQQIRNSMPKQTYCNKIGNQTFCNTF